MSARHVGILAGLGVAGAGFLLAKGVIRATAGDDLSFVPAYIFFTGFGIWGLAETVAWTRRFRWLVFVGRALAALAVVSGLVALSYVLTGTIPETDGAPAAVGVFYGLGAAAIYVGQLVLAIGAWRSEALPGRRRWAPLAVVILQFPVFIAAEAIGGGLDDEGVTDGLGMALTGALWAGSSIAVGLTAQYRALQPHRHTQPPGA